MEPTYLYLFIAINFAFGKALYKFLVLTNKSDSINDVYTYLTVSISLAFSVQAYMPYKYLGHEDHK